MVTGFHRPSDPLCKQEGKQHLRKDNISVYVYKVQRAFRASAFEVIQAPPYHNWHQSSDRCACQDYMQHELPASIIRAKGLLWFEGIPRTVIFQMSGRRTNPFETVETLSQPTDSSLVLFGKDFDAAAIKLQLDALCY